SIASTVAQGAHKAAKPSAHSLGHALGWLTDRISAVRHLRSRYLVEEALVYFTREPRAILMRLKQANHGFVDRFRFLPQIMDFQPDQSRRPVQRFRNAGDLAQIL